ncbi:dihydrofolate reductase family protein [Cryobacterium tepidiphilum]|uniref:Deaminase n=1 Tax=Cryobacterium tepidiphilum TaxID=2486026 RepID=A0A3M8LH47_9MICO|nr:dihydrofolate reductase family protein [Cryobacterium tepidiphilum]RNE63808.1 deaminase [Cryobacterium tepidiphilum]
MARLVYSTITSLDGYVADESGDFSWAAPDEEVHAFVNDTQRRIGTFLCGRKLYEVMAWWDTVPLEGEPPVMWDYAGIWRDADKVVYSRTLESVPDPRTRIEHDFDADAVRAMKDSSSRDISVGGPDLAGQALASGLVDEVEVFAVPWLIGGGTPAYPRGIRVALDLLEERRFTSGVAYLRYNVKG